jgi:hypothetical protein
MDLLRSWLHKDNDARQPVRATAQEPGGGVIKEAPMKIDGRCLSIEQFVRHVEDLDFPYGLPTRIFLHHTWKPTRETWAGLHTILGMKAYYERQLWTDLDGRVHEGWTAGPHLFVADDGIWLFSDLRQDGVGVAGHNRDSWHLEMVGNYDVRLPDGATLHNTIAALGIMHERIGLPPERINFHRDYSTKTCPGVQVQKSWVIPQVQRWVAEYRLEKMRRQPTLRQTLLNLVDELILPDAGETALSGAARGRGLLGPVTKAVPIEVGGRAYVVQLFAEALLAPADTLDQAQSLREFERVPRQDDLMMAAAVDDELPVYDVSNPPFDVVDFDGELR